MESLFLSVNGQFLVSREYCPEDNTAVESSFLSVNYVKPKASRPSSKEIYLIARHFKGRP